MQIWPGRPYPLGATYDGAGTNFALFSEVADRVELCLFDDDGAPRPGSSCPRPTASSGTATCPASARASATATGCTARTTRRSGHRCNPAKLLLDPYAKAIEGQIDGDESLFAYRFATAGRAQRPRQPRPHACSSVVINPFFDWGNDRHRRHDVPRDGDLRGARQGPDDDPPGAARGAPRHVRRHRPPGDHRAPHGARRHRGRADAGAPVRPRPPPGRAGACPTTGATTPSASSPRTTPTPPAGSAASRCRSSRRWCKALHAAGIEVILDVVYNHTAEGNQLGPTLSFRGIDNAAYYRLVDDDKAHYYDSTGTGNTLLMRHPHVLQLIMDSLRYWVHGDARRRLPLRPRVDAGPAVPRGRPAVGVLRPGPAGPGGLARSS